MPEKAISAPYAAEFSAEENLLDSERPTIRLHFHHHGQTEHVEELDFDMARALACALCSWTSHVIRDNILRRRFR